MDNKGIISLISSVGVRASSTGDHELFTSDSGTSVDIMLNRMVREGSGGAGYTVSTRVEEE